MCSAFKSVEPLRLAQWFRETAAPSYADIGNGMASSARPFAAAQTSDEVTERVGKLDALAIETSQAKIETVTTDFAKLLP